LHRRGLQAPGDEAALRELVGDLIASPLDHSKALWDMYLIDRPEGGCALIVRMHHCIADGIALARVMLSLTDTASGEEPAGTNTTHTSSRGILAGLAQEGLKTLRNPAHVLDLADSLSADAQALAKLLFSPADAKTALRGELGVARRVAWTGQMELAEVKAIAHAQGATVNDVLLAAVSGALRRHLQSRGEEPRAIRTFVPFNLRPLDEPIPRELGNRFGLVFLTLPVDVGGRRARLEELKRRMAAIKRSPEGPISYAILEAVGLTPPQLESRIVDIFTAKASAVMTNVPGPREVVYLAGTPVRAVLVWAPTSGSVGMSVSIFSYRGEVTIGLLVDAGLVPEPHVIARHTEQELAALGRLKPVAKARPARMRGGAAKSMGT
jgi:diacylglycerol O-acyltransferase / wax synthase